MKNLILLMFVVTILGSCSFEKTSEYPRYSISIMEHTPDSLIDKKAQFIVDVVDAASNRGMGGDYEDVDDTIEEAKKTANQIYSIKISCLHIETSSQDYGSNVSPSAMTKYQRVIFDQLCNEGELKTVEK